MPPQSHPASREQIKQYIINNSTVHKPGTRSALVAITLPLPSGLAETHARTIEDCYQAMTNQLMEDDTLLQEVVQLIQNEDGITVKDWGWGQIELKNTVTAFYDKGLLAEIHHKQDGAVGDKPSFAVVIVHGITCRVIGEISLDKLQKAMYKLGYDLKKREP